MTSRDPPVVPIRRGHGEHDRGIQVGLLAAKLILLKQKEAEMAEVRQEATELLGEYQTRKEAFMKTQEFEKYQARKKEAP